MILFDGIDIRSVAGVKIDEIRVSGIQYQTTERARAVVAGADLVRNRAASRVVAVQFCLLSQHMNVRQAALDAISAWAKTDKEYKLQLPGHPDRYLMAVCTSKPDPSLKQWWEKLRLTFKCVSDPYWIDNTEKSAACGTSFLVLGDAPPIMRIERTLSASASDQAYSDGTNTMTFSTIPAGDLVIDLDPEKQTAVVGNTSIMQYYNVNSKFIVPRTGTQTITGTGTVKYRERWS